MAPGAPKHKLEVQPVVFAASTLIILAVVTASVVAADHVGIFFEQVQQTITDKLGWLYVLSMTGFLVFAIWLMCSRFGRIRLGPDNARPEFSRPTWFAMLFSAGMGIGLLFFSVAEPILHYSSPPVGNGETLQAARNAMGLTFFHWGLHPWAVYAIVGLALAYFGFRRELPFSIRSTFYPLLGDCIHGRFGDVIDTLAIVSTLFGVATSLGLGAMQVNAGLSHVSGIAESITTQIAIIVAITAIATVSVVSGLHTGIRRLSELNMGLAGLLLLFLLIAGPTAFLLNAFVDNIGAYLQRLPSHSFWTAHLEEPTRQRWLGLWTVFYWAWWIAWAPFVGMFIARVSKGRTIREFLFAVLVAPTLTGFVWLTVFGNTALHEQIHNAGGISQAVTQNLPTAIFVLLERFPLAEVTSVICTTCIILFFVTSSDSASLVVDTIASGGKQNPPVFQRVYWAILEGIIAAVLLVVGGLKALQTGQSLPRFHCASLSSQCAFP